MEDISGWGLARAVGRRLLLGNVAILPGVGVSKAYLDSRPALTACRLDVTDATGTYRNVLPGLSGNGSQRSDGVLLDRAGCEISYRTVSLGAAVVGGARSRCYRDTRTVGCRAEAAGRRSLKLLAVACLSRGTGTEPWF